MAVNDCKWRIWEEKCLLLMRIQCLEEGSLAKMIYQEAEDNGWPGLGKEVRQICRELNIPDINLYRIQKAELQKALKFSHKEDMMKQFQSSKKLEDIKESNFNDIQPYFNDKNIENARIKFRIRTKMLKKVPGNFKNLYKNVPNGLKCDFCEDEMTQNHCISCPGRKEYRKDLDMNNLDDLVSYFKIILGEKSQR